MARLPDILGSLEAEAKKVYDRIASKRGRIGGPFAALMHHPPPAERVAAVGEYLLNLIKNGGATIGKPSMPAFGYHLTDSEIRDLIAYLRAMPASK